MCGCVRECVCARARACVCVCVFAHVCECVRARENALGKEREKIVPVYVNIIML